jgi:hypothetical protein
MGMNRIVRAVQRKNNEITVSFRVESDVMMARALLEFMNQKWWVDSVNGSDASDGTKAFPLKTFKEASRRFPPGIVFLIPLNITLLEKDE